MRKAGKIIAIGATVIIVILYILSSFTPYINPATFPFATFLSLVYLPLLIVYFFIMICWLFSRKKIALLLFLLLFIGYKNLFCTVSFNIPPGKWVAAKDTNSIRLLCWNVNKFGDPMVENDSAGSVRQQFLQFIKETQPDIICFQDFAEKKRKPKIFVQNIRDIQAMCNLDTSHYAWFYEFDGYVHAKLGVVIFSRLPLIDTGSISNNGQNINERTPFIDVLFKGKPLRVVASHLSSMSLWPNSKEEAGLKYLEGDSTKDRAKNIYSRIRYFGGFHAKEAETIKSFMDKSPYPLIFSADLNSVPSGYVYHRLKKGLNDAFLEKDWGIGGTYDRLFPRIRIDVLFHSKELKVIQFSRPTPDLSDHYPLIADMQWKN